jgi:hypothetical protein
MIQALRLCTLAASVAAVMFAAVPASAATAAKTVKPSFSQLPDWSGTWTRAGGGFYEQKPGAPEIPAPAPDSPLNIPPYTPKYKAIFEENQKKIAADLYPDPVSFCGTPIGWPRILATPDGYEFIVRPEQTWILSENGPNIVRIYTDGRSHPAPEDMWPTYTGDSVGHWEGDTLVFTSIGMKGYPATIIGRNGVVVSPSLRTTTRVQLQKDGRLKFDLVMEDPEAFTRPWTVTAYYKRFPPGTRIYDYACAENNRNPVTEEGRTLTRDTSGNVMDKVK